MTSILITGGAGFIGSHLAEALVSRGHRVTVLDNLSTGKIENLSSVARDVDFIQGDIRDASTVEAAAEGCHTVFHLAALVSVFESVTNPVLNDDINVRGLLHVLEAARINHVEKVIFASSAAVYGSSPDLPKHESMSPEPVSPYGVAKLTGEYYLKCYASLHGIKTACLRYFNVYGPRQDAASPYSGVISSFIAALHGGRDPVIYGDGGQTRDFVYVNDVVAANLLAAETDIKSTNPVFNIATGQRTSLLDLCGELKKLSADEFHPVFQPERDGDIRDSVADIQKAREALLFEPAWNVSKGLKELWNSVVRA